MKFLYSVRNNICKSTYTKHKYPVYLKKSKSFPQQILGISHLSLILLILRIKSNPKMTYYATSYQNQQAKVPLVFDNYQPKYSVNNAAHTDTDLHWGDKCDRLPSQT